jgi:hypothetical protein
MLPGLPPELPFGSARLGPHLTETMSARIKPRPRPRCRGRRPPKGLTADRIRYHTCYSINIRPRVHEAHFLAPHHVVEMRIARPGFPGETGGLIRTGMRGDTAFATRLRFCMHCVEACWGV